MSKINKCTNLIMNFSSESVLPLFEPINYPDGLKTILSDNKLF